MDAIISFERYFNECMDGNSYAHSSLNDKFIRLLYDPNEWFDFERQAHALFHLHLEGLNSDNVEFQMQIAEFTLRNILIYLLDLH